MSEEAKRTEEIRQRSEAVPRGRGLTEWNADAIYNSIMSDVRSALGETYEDERVYATAEFIAHSREDIPYLLEHIAELKARIETLLEENRYVWQRSNEMYANKYGERPPYSGEEDS